MGQAIREFFCRLFGLMSRLLGRSPSRFPQRPVAIAFATLLGIGIAGGLHAANYTYVYDELGRLVQVVAADGSSSQYSYDAAGNITGIKANTVNTIAISDLSPDFGATGTQVTIYGSGFSTTPSSNAVKFNGATATVASASGNMLRVIVPATATTGLVTVANTNGTATSSTKFNVAAGAGPAITSFTPTIGQVGETVTIVGKNFSTTNSDNRVLFGGLPGQVSGTPTATTMNAAVGSLAQAGKLTVITPYGSATSTNEFFLLPGVADASKWTQAKRVALNGAVETVNASVAGQGVMYLFDGVSGQDVSVGAVGGTFAPNDGLGSVSVYLVDSKGATLGACRYYGGSNKCTFPTLTASGPYRLMVGWDSNHSGSFSLYINADLIVQAALPFNAPISLARPGQNTTYTFSAKAGQGFGVAVPGILTGQKFLFSWRDPSLKNVELTFSDYCELGLTQTLPECFMPVAKMSGTYRVQVIPDPAATAQINVAITADTTGVLAAGSSPTVFVAQLEGQNGRYSFLGLSGQGLNLNWSGSITDYSISLISPLGEILGHAESGANLYFQKLPATGNYTVLIDPKYGTKGQLSISMLTDTTDAIAVDGASKSIALIAGQTANFAFSGTAGQRIGLGVTGLSTPPDGTTRLDIAVLSADGKAIFSDSKYAYSAGFSNFDLDVPALPRNGSYTVQIKASANLAGNLTASTDLPDTLPNDGSLIKVFQTNRAGQNGYYTFNAIVGDNYNLTWGVTAGFTTRGTIKVLSPSKNVVATEYSFGGGAGASGKLALTNLAENGVYMVMVDPDSAGTGSVDLKLLPDVTGSFVIGGAPTPISLQAGQRARYAGEITSDRVSIGFSNLTFQAGKSPRVSLVGLGNVKLADCSPTSATNFDCPVSSIPGADTVIAYTLLIDAASETSGNVYVSSVSSAALPVDGVFRNYGTSRPGQYARYTFNATAGDNFIVNWSGATYVNGNDRLSLMDPEGRQVGVFSDYFATKPAGSTAFGNLLRTGSYALTVLTDASSSGAVNLSLNKTGVTAPVAQVVDGGVVLDGASVTVAISSGASKKYTFSGKAGNEIGLGLTAVTSAPAGTGYAVSLYAPDNVTEIKSCGWFSGSTNCRFPPLPSSGSYTILIKPDANSSGNLTLTLSRALKFARSTADGPFTIASSRPGQFAQVSFIGNLGDIWTYRFLNASQAGTLNAIDPLKASIASRSFNHNWSPSGKDTLGPFKSFGIYKLEAVPNDGAALGTVDLDLVYETWGDITVNGASTAFNLSADQIGEYFFSGFQGQQISLMLSGVNLSPSGSLEAQLFSISDGVRIYASCSMTTYNAGKTACDFGTLLRSDDYVLRLVPQGTATGSMSLTMGTMGSLVPGAVAKTFNATRDAQVATYSLQMNATDAYQVVQSSSTFADGGSMVLTRPDGTFDSMSLTAAGDTVTKSTFSILNIKPLAGSYKLKITPNYAETGSASFQLFKGDKQTFSALGTPLNLNLLAGQIGVYAFSATAGTKFDVSVVNPITSPAGGEFYIDVLLPDGETRLQQADRCIRKTSGMCPMPTLPQDGTYYIVVTPRNAAGLSAGLVLVSR